MSEKLNEIKENWNNVDWGIDKDDIDWLIEQAEKAERYEKALERIMDHSYEVFGAVKIAKQALEGEK